MKRNALRIAGFLILIFSCFYLYTYANYLSYEKGGQTIVAYIPYILVGMGIACGLRLLDVIYPLRAPLDGLPGLLLGVLVYVFGTVSPLWMGGLRQAPIVPFFGMQPEGITFPPLAMAYLGILLVMVVEALLRGGQLRRFNKFNAIFLFGAMALILLLDRFVQSILHAMSTSAEGASNVLLSVLFYLLVWLSGVLLLPAIKKSTDRPAGALLLVAGLLGIFSWFFASSILYNRPFWPSGQFMDVLGRTVEILAYSLLTTRSEICLYAALCISGVYLLLPERVQAYIPF